MAPVYLHIGLSKTGTTACQHAFEVHRDRLQGAGLLYPKAGIESDHHFHLAQALLAARPVADADRHAVLHALQAERKAAGLPVLISSEHFSDADDRDIAAIADFFGPQTIVIVSLRNQVDWCSAMYAEAIRWGSRLTFAGYLEYLQYDLDFQTLLGRWENGIGRERIEVIAYDRHRHDLATMILSRAGVTDLHIARVADEMRRHPTLSAPFVQLQHELSEEGVGRALESGLRRIETQFKQSGVEVPQAWRIPDRFAHGMWKLDVANDRIADAYGLPKPLFGQSVHDLLTGNLAKGYAAPSIADWLITAQPGTSPLSRTG